MLSTFTDVRQKTALEKALSGGIGYFEGDYVSVTGGKSSTIKTIYAPIFSEDGSVVGGVSITENIAERKKAEEELNKRVEELERWQRLTIDREVKMVELKKKIKELESEIERLRRAR